MRNYEHLRDDKGDILLPDKRSAKATYGLHSKEYLDSKDPHFLREGHSTIPPQGLVFQLTEESDGCAHNYAGKAIGDGMIAVEGQGASGGYFEHGIHKSKVKWH